MTSRSCFFLLCVLALAGCEKNRVFERNQPLRHHAWDKTDSLTFEVDISDTSVAYNMYINVRHSADYRYNNLWVNVHTVLPSGERGDLKQELRLDNTEHTGWLGDCVGDICDVRVAIGTGLRFVQKGVYTFTLSHLMWDDTVDAIMSMGLRVEKRPA